MRRQLKWICFFLTLLGIARGVVIAQENTGEQETLLDKQLFEVERLRLQSLLISTTITDSLVIDLVRDAEAHAEQQDWQNAAEMLNLALELIELDKEIAASVESSTDIPASKELSTKRYIQIESGLDYSQQEFETAFLESDSVIIEELQNPFFSFYDYQPWQFGGSELLFTQRFRLDEELINYTALTSLEHRSSQLNQKIEIESGFYHDRRFPDSDFLDSRLNWYFGNNHFTKHRYFADTRIRWKYYPQDNRSFEDLLSGSAHFFYEFLHEYTQSLAIGWNPAFYNELAEEGFQYFQNRLEMYYRFRPGFNEYIELGATQLYQSFRTKLGEGAYRNHYWSLQPRLTMEVPLSKSLTLAGRAELEYRTYREPDIFYPDFLQWEIEPVLKYYFGDLKSVGVGYVHDRQSYAVALTDEQLLAEQGDYQSNGLFFSLDYFNLKGTLINLEYRLTWRNYPNADDTILNTYYSDRKVHSISLLGWLPLNQYWQIQAFINYDNDQDRNYNLNDSRHVLMNIGIVYKL